MATVTIDHYSDLLCVWAYIAHARTVELQAQYPDSIDWRWHYLSVFGDVQTKFKDQWQERGGSAGYAAHVLDVLQDFDHVVINPDCWTRVQPALSAPAHLWLAYKRGGENCRQGRKRRLRGTCAGPSSEMPPTSGPRTS